MQFAAFVALAAAAVSVNAAAVSLSTVTAQPTTIDLPSVSIPVTVTGTPIDLPSVSIPVTATTPPPSTPSSPAGPSDIDCITSGKYLDWYQGQWQPECIALIYKCHAETDKLTTYMWSKTSCVAAATCSGVWNLNTRARCVDHLFPTQQSTPHLSYNVYADIVGACAWQEGGCPITKQKYIDWFYGALSKAGTKTWPPNVDAVINEFWNPILAWTKTGDVLPYKNFDDWLHYSNSR